MASLAENYSVYKKYLQNIIILYKKRQDIQVFTELILSLSAIGFFSIFAIRPTLLTIGKLQTEIKGKEETITTMDQKIKDLIVAQDLFEREKNKIALLNQAVPNEPEPQIYVRQIEGLAKKAGVRIVNMNVDKVDLINQEPEPQTEITSQVVAKEIPYPQNAKDVRVSLSVTSDYNSLKSFLNELETTRRPILIDSFNFGIAEGEQDIELVLSITGRIPFINE